VNKKAIVIGMSAGETDALKTILKDIDSNDEIPFIIVTHIRSNIDGLMQIYRDLTGVEIKEAEDGESIEEGHIYFSPPGYHLSIEDDYTFSLAIEEKVNYARPSIDVLFNSAAEVYKKDLIGIILTGANNDGAAGLKRVEELGGRCIVQNPQSAYMSSMPESAINSVDCPAIMELNEINEYLKCVLTD
jgi:two-component system chemotaxis response regulator CheB